MIDMKIAEKLLKSNNQDDIDRGIMMVTRLSSSGDPMASYALATWKIFAINGFETDINGAEELLKVAMNGRVPEAFFDYAVMVSKRKKKSSYREAFPYFIISAMMGDADAIRAVSDALYCGRGVSRNVEASRFIDQVFLNAHGN